MDDYIHKPTIEEELVLKVKLSLHRADRQHDINYLTYLPGHASLVKELQKRIDAKIIFAVAHLNLYKLRYYNHRYGFEKGDEMIKYVCSLIINALKEFGSPSDFLSNPYNENFVFLTQLDSIEAIVNKIIDEFNKIYLSFYDENDKKRGYLIIKTRAGGLEKIPLMSIHAGITNNEHYAFINPAQVLQITRELIDFAEKSSPEKSMLVKERRRNYPFY